MTLSEYFYNDIYKNLFGKTWPKWVGAIVLALLNILLFLYIMPLGGIYPAIADWGIWTYKLVGINITPPWGSLQYPHLSIISVLSFSLILGVLAAALLSRQFKIRKDTVSGYIQGFLGGALMGIGSFIVGACIIGGFYSSIMSLSLSGFYMMIGLILGGYVGGKLMVWQGHKKAEKVLLDFKVVPKNVTTKEYKSIQPKIGVIVTIMLIIFSSIYFLKGMNLFGGVILFGAIFGIVFQRSAFCLTGAFREVFTTKSNGMIRNVMLSLMIGVIGFSIIKANGFRSASMFVLPAGWHSLLGGAIFGFGMVITGG
jgi:uncharacterized membrane protein YedE/YeeE